MEKCYDYLDCKQPGCKMYNNGDKVNCWEMEGTLCFQSNLIDIKNNLCKEFCTSCSFYKYAQKEI